MEIDLTKHTKLHLIQMITDRNIVLKNNISKIEFLTKDRNNVRLELEKLQSEQIKLRSEISALKDQIHRQKQVIHTLGESIEKLGLALAH